MRFALLALFSPTLLLPTAQAQYHAEVDTSGGEWIEEPVLSPYGALTESAKGLLVSGLYDEAALLYERAAAVLPEEDEAQAGAGWAMLLKGDIDAAAQHFASVIRSEDESHDLAVAHDWGLAAVAFHQGHREDGVRLFGRHSPGYTCNHGSLLADTKGVLLEAVQQANPAVYDALRQTAFNATAALVREHPHESLWIELLEPFDDSRAIFHEEATRHPSSIPLRLAVARSSGDGASQAYEAVLALDPSNYAARIGLADEMGLNGRTTEAAAVLRALVRSYPDSARVHYALYSSLYRLGQRSEAQAALSRADALDPQVSARARLFAGLQAIVGLCQFGLQWDEDSNSWQGTEQAIRCNQRILHHNPEEGAAWQTIGTIQYLAGDAEAAVVPLQTAAALMPDSVTARVLLAEALLDLGRKAEALSAIAEALSLDQSDSRALYLHAAIIEEEDRPAAIRYLRRAIAARHGFTEALHHLGRLLLLDGDADEAARQLELARSLNGESVPTAYWLGRAYATAGRTSDALAEATRLEGLDPSAAADLHDFIDLTLALAEPVSPFGVGWSYVGGTDWVDYWVRTDDVRGSRSGTVTFWAATSAPEGQEQAFRQYYRSRYNGTLPRPIHHEMSQFEASCSRGAIRPRSEVWYDASGRVLDSATWPAGASEWVVAAPNTVNESLIAAACGAVP